MTQSRSPDDNDQAGAADDKPNRRRIRLLTAGLVVCCLAVAVAVTVHYTATDPVDQDPATRSRRNRQDLDDAPLSKSGYRSMVKLTAFEFTRDLSGTWVVSGRVTNTGTRTLNQVEVTVVCMDADKAPIYTEKIYPVFTREIDVPDVPYTPALKPSATADFRSTIAPDALGAEPKHIRASVTNVEFAF